MRIFQSPINRINQTILNYRLQRAIKLFRKEMAWWGYPLDQFTDQELIDGCYRFGEITSQCGITISEMITAFDCLANTTIPVSHFYNKSAPERSSQ